MFDPQPHLIKLPRKVKDKATGHWTTVSEDYLEVKWRLCWFRDRYPHGVLTTEEICVDLDRGYARYRCVVEDGQGGRATGFGTETAADFADYCERAETRAIGRALAALGIGTQFVGQDLAELPHVADAPVRATTAPLADGSHHSESVAEIATGVATPNGDAPVSVTTAQPSHGRDNAEPVTDVVTIVTAPNGDTPPRTAADLPTRIPAGLQLPCADAWIVDLRPPQLSLLIGKVGLKALADPSLEPLHVALLAERARRFEGGQRSTAEANGHGG